MSNMQRLTPEDIADIRRSYRDAKYPEHQLSILGQLYLLTKAEVMEVCGVLPAKRYAGDRHDYRTQDVRRLPLLRAVLVDGMGIAEAARRHGVKLNVATEWVKRERARKGDDRDKRRAAALPGHQPGAQTT